MLRVLEKMRSIAAWLSAIVLLSLWTTAMAGVFCPHTRGGRDCCLLAQSRVHSQAVAPDLQVPIEHADIQQGQMSDMDMEDTSMDMAEMLRPSAEQDSDIDMTKVSAPADSEELALTQENEPCSHCMMHSRSSERFPASFAENNLSDQIISADTSATSLNTLSAALGIVVLHDHGPPGSVAARYILDGSFRI